MDLFCVHDQFGKIYLIKSRRRSLAVTFSAQGEVVIKAPTRITKAQVLNFLNSAANWIATHQAKMLDKLSKISNHTFFEGDKFYYLGEVYPLEFGEESLFTGRAFQVINRDKELIIKELHKIYKSLAATYLKSHTAFVARKFNIKYNNIRITSANRSWGSCSSLGNLNFSWNLIMCDDELIDYVVCHELAHRIELNHSKNFWTIVDKMCPNYQILRKRLRDNSFIYAKF